MNKKLLGTIFVSGLAVVISFLINFFLTSYITENIGIDAYGFVGISKSFVNYATIITVAFTVFIVRYISLSYHREDYETARGYYSASIFVCFVLSIILAIFGIVTVLILHFIINIPPELIVPVKILFSLIFTNFIISTFTTPFSAAAIIKNKLILSGIIKIVSYSIDAFALWLLFTNLNPQIWYVGIASISATTFILIGNYALTKKYTSELKFDKKLISFRKIRDLVGNGFWDAVNQLGNELNSGLDLLISNWYLNDVSTGQITVTKTTTLMFSVLSSTIYTSVQPNLVKAYSKNDSVFFISEEIKAMKICGYFTCLAGAGFFALGKLFYQLWLPSQDYSFLYLLTLISVTNQMTDGIMKPIYYISTLTVKNKIPCIITIIGGVLNVLSMILLINFTSLGAIAVVGTTAVIMLLINIFFNPIYASKCIKSKPGFIYKVMLRYFVSIILMCACFWGIQFLISPSSWLEFILSALLMAALSVPIYLACINSVGENKIIIRKVVGKFLKSNKKDDGTI